MKEDKARRSRHPKGPESERERAKLLQEAKTLLENGTEEDVKAYIRALEIPAGSPAAQRIGARTANLRNDLGRCSRSCGTFRRRKRSKVFFDNRCNFLRCLTKSLGAPHRDQYTPQLEIYFLVIS